MASGTPWTATQTLARAQPGSRAPALATIGETVHMVWHSAGTLYHSGLAETGWSSPVPVAMGGEPALAVTPDGDLHCLFSNRFAGNDEIYHATWHAGHWSLPRNVSNTSGASTHPAVVVDAGGALQAVWTDTTPGQAVTYHGRYEGEFWTSMPVSNGRGQNPALAAGPAGRLYVAWQDVLASGDVYDIFCVAYGPEAWGLPDNVSDTGQTVSIQPSLAVDTPGLVHVVWQEQQGQTYQIYYAVRGPEGWNVPAGLTVAGDDCLLPRIVINPHGLAELIWLAGGTLWHRSGQPRGQMQWLAAEAAVAGLRGASDLALAVSPRGRVHVAWSAVAGDGMQQVYYAQREPVLKHQLYFPVM